MRRIDFDCCERCSETAVGPNADGNLLCEDCLFAELVDESQPRRRANNRCLDWEEIEREFRRSSLP